MFYRLLPKGRKHQDRNARGIGDLSHGVTFGTLVMGIILITCILLVSYMYLACIVRAIADNGYHY
jgi:hypothetical protein